jgi:hypothetical protein
MVGGRRARATLAVVARPLTAIPLTARCVLDVEVDHEQVARFELRARTA